jgi:hypothetical protein
MRLTLALAVTLLCLPLGIAACGDDDDSGGGQPRAFEVQATEDGGETIVTAPDSVEPGAIEIRFSNDGERRHSLQVVQLGEGHTADEVAEAGESWAADRGELPEWIRFLGGIGSTKPGGSGIAAVDLPEGEYAAFDIEGNAFSEFTVEGDEGESLEEVPATVEAVEYDFTATALEAGSQRVLFENNGEEPHHLVAAPMKPGKTQADLEEALQSEDAPAPFVESKSLDTAILSGGERTVVDLRLESGDYALMCFIPDRAGGPPHVAKGMATIVPVE